MPQESGSIRTLTVDIGGSGVKTMVLDETGNALTERNRVQTPQPPKPNAVIDAITQLAAQQGEFHRVSVGFPGVVRGGVTYTAVNLDPDWAGFDFASTLSQRLGKPVRVANDADVQGMGAIAGKGVELVITLGTGFGSALFVDGKLVPNLEMGHHPFRKGETYEQQLGRAALDKVGQNKWNNRLGKAIATLEHLFNYDFLYIGGGEAKKITIELPSNVKIVPNVTGLFGGIALWRD
ncbi:MAG TPA: ROK family protein [Coleofasciculaceae cyanobacterium]